MLEGEVDEATQNYSEPLEERGHSLLVVNLLSLKPKFSFKRFRIDIIGFGWAILFVIAIFVLGLLIANIG